MLDYKFWEKYFEVYDVLNLLIPYRELLDTICNELDIKKGEKILEAGCGTGNLSLEMNKRGAEVIGLDNCKEALEIYQKKNLKAKTILADLTKELPFSNEYFDKIACNNTLYAIPRDKQLAILKEFYRVLKPNGTIVLVNPKVDWKPFKIYLDGIKRMFQKNGFSKSVYRIFRAAAPTIKILHFNNLIEKEIDYHFFEFDEQKNLFQKANFSKVAEPKYVYAEQCILSSARK